MAAVHNSTLCVTVAAMRISRAADVAHGAVIDMATIPHPVNPERATVAESVSHDNRVRGRRAHEGRAGERSIEVAGRARVVPGMAHVPARGETSDAPWMISSCRQIGDEGLKARGEVRGDRDAASRRLNGYQAAMLVWGSMGGLVPFAPAVPRTQNSVTVPIVPNRLRRWQRTDGCKDTPRHSHRRIWGKKNRRNRDDDRRKTDSQSVASARLMVQSDSSQ